MIPVPREFATRCSMVASTCLVPASPDWDEIFGAVIFVGINWVGSLKNFARNNGENPFQKNRHVV